MAANNVGTLVTAPIRPVSHLDTYPSAYADEIKGGAHQVADLTARDAITTDRRVDSMLVSVQSDNKTYQLVDGITNSDWVVFPGGGAGTDNDQSTETAGEALSGYVGAVLVSGGVFTFDNTNAAHLGTVRGVTTQSAASGAPVVVQVGGKLTNVGWALTVGRVYLSATGQVTNSAPASGIMQPIGFAISSTIIVVEITNPIQQI